MQQSLPRTQLAFDNCRHHLNATDSQNTEIAAYLIQHILVVLCAEIQQEICAVVECKAEFVADIALQNFTVTASKKILRSIKKK